MKDSFQHNVQRWSILYPEEAKSIASLNCSHVDFTKTDKGELNLIKREADQEFLLHSNEDAVQEAQRWFNQLDLTNVNVLYVYGVGLGYYYEAAKAWLQQSGNFLVFLEDDLEVIHRLFETEQGARLLNDKKVRIHWFDGESEKDKVWRELPELYGLRPMIFSALRSYGEHYKAKTLEFHSRLKFFTDLIQSLQNEYADHGYRYYYNFYQNIQHLPLAKQAKGLFDIFKGVPAIICGAGPSLDKNLALVETLADRALIFAGGTAMNAVNSRGFIPHFGVGIDPNEEQWARLIIQAAYEVPFFYRNRFNSSALHLAHGTHLFVTGAGGHSAPKWFEKKLGIAGVEISEGFNVINFSLAIACQLGCNPIIFVGMDLAYSDHKSYQSGVTSHPIHGRKYFITKGEGEELMTARDIHGEPVFTLSKWIGESAYISQFTDSYPNTLFINATEGGIGMPGIPNKPLHEVIHYLLGRSYPLRLRVHGEIQHCAMPDTVTSTNIRSLSEELRTSLQHCENECKRLHEEWMQQLKVRQVTTTDAMQRSLETLTDEPAYTHLLQEFDHYYQSQQKLDRQMADYDPNVSEEERAGIRAMLNAMRYRALFATAHFHSDLINLLILSKPLQELQESISQSSATNVEVAGYSFENNQIVLIDPDLDINIRENDPQPIVEEHLFYPNNAIKLQQYSLNNELHGPITFYSEEGRILARSWYVHGVQQGKSWLYDQSGALYALQQMKDGQWEGVQTYYYPSEEKKTVLHYHQGKLDGEVLLYHRNGKLKRQQQFVSGQRDGYDRLWNESGLLRLEGKYDHGRPVGIAKSWHENGQLSQEVIFAEDGQIKSVHKWDEFGNLIPEAQREDFVDLMTKQITLLTESLDNVYNQLEKITPLIVPFQQQDVLNQIKQDFASLRDELIHLKKLGKEMVAEAGVQNMAEPFWKTPASRRELQKQLATLTEKLQKEIGSLQTIVKGVQKKQKDAPQ